jgi:peptide deformylase
MIETMHAAGGVGLAAPQVDVGLQLFVYELPADDPAAAERPGPRVVANPMLVAQPGELVYDWEGCLSIPDLRGLVPRHPGVRLRALDRDGAAVDTLATGFEARVIQHEHDHLNAVVFLDRMRDLRSLAFYDEWQRYLAGGDDQPADPV